MNEAQIMGTPKKDTRERKALERFCSYLDMVRNINELEPSSYEQATSEHVWRDAKVEDYSSIMKNDVWEVLVEF